MKINSSIQAASPQFGWNPLKSIVTPLILLTGLASCSPKLPQQLEHDTFEYQSPIPIDQATILPQSTDQYSWSDMVKPSDIRKIHQLFRWSDSNNPEHFEYDDSADQKAASLFFSGLVEVVDDIKKRLVDAGPAAKSDLQKITGFSDFLHNIGRAPGADKVEMYAKYETGYDAGKNPDILDRILNPNALGDQLLLPGGKEIPEGIVLPGQKNNNGGY